MSETMAAFKRRSWLLSLAKKTPEELEHLAEELERQARDLRVAAQRARLRMAQRTPAEEATKAEAKAEGAVRRAERDWARARDWLAAHGGSPSEADWPAWARKAKRQLDKATIALTVTKGSSVELIPTPAATSGAPSGPRPAGRSASGGSVFSGGPTRLPFPARWA